MTFRSALLLSLTLPLLLAQAGWSAPAAWTGTLEIVMADGSPSPTLVTGSGLGSFDTVSGAVSFGSGAFTTNTTTPVGFTPNAPPSNIFPYVIRQITNSSSGAASFAPANGPGGGFGGVMDVGAGVTVELGLVPLPNVFGSYVIPLGAGVPGFSSVVSPLIFGRTTFVTVQGTGWTTGQISASDPGTGSIDRASAYTVTGSNGLTANGNGQLVLVTPFSVVVPGAINQIVVRELRLGYVRLVLNLSVPEPGTLVLLACAGVAAAAGGATARRRREQR